MVEPGLVRKAITDPGVPPKERERPRVANDIQTRSRIGLPEDIKDWGGVHHIADAVEFHDQDSVDVRARCAPERDESLQDRDRFGQILVEDACQHPGMRRRSGKVTARQGADGENHFPEQQPKEFEDGLDQSQHGTSLVY
jgi:hypothetical protein